MKAWEELREWKAKAHKHLDRLWKEKIFTRSEVYEMLEIVFHKEVHIADADIKMCKEIIKKLTFLESKRKKKSITPSN